MTQQYPHGQIPRQRLWGNQSKVNYPGHAPVMLWLTDTEGKVVFTNSKRNTFLGVASERATLASDAWIAALHPDDLELCMKMSLI